MHASLMLFLFVIPMLAGFGNYAVPLMIGAPDMAFPRINALSFWMLPLAGIIMLTGFLVPGGAAAAGWTSYAPLAGGQVLGHRARTCGSWPCCSSARARSWAASTSSSRSSRCARPG